MKQTPQTLSSRIDKLSLKTGTEAVRTRITGWGYSAEEIEEGVKYFDARVLRNADMSRRREERKNLPAIEIEAAELRRKESERSFRKAQRDYVKNMSEEDRAQYYSNRKYDKEMREFDKLEKKRKAELKANINRERALLKYMLKSDVIFYHHSTEDSMRKSLERALKQLEEGNFMEYNNYVWNRLGEGNNFLPLAQMGNLWRSTEEFPTIYDVPLDGTYIFYITDSGERGLGAFNYMKCKKVEVPVEVPFVNPGGLPQITAR